MSVGSKDPCDCNDLPQMPEFSFFTDIAQTKLAINLDSVDTLEEIPFKPNKPPPLSKENQHFIDLGNNNGYNSFQERYDKIRQYVSDRKKQRDIKTSIFTCFKENKPQFSGIVQRIITSKTEEDTKRFERDDPWIGYKKEIMEMLYGDVDMNCGKLNYVFNMRKYYQLCIDQVNREMKSLVGEENKHTKKALRILEEQKTTLSTDPKILQSTMLSNALDEKTYGQVSLADAMKKDRTDMRKLDGYKELHGLFSQRIQDLTKYTTDEYARYVFEECKPQVAPGGGQAAPPAAPIQPQTSGTGRGGMFSGQIKEMFTNKGAGGGPKPGMKGGNADTNSIIKILERNADYYITYSNLLLYLTSLNYYYLDKTAPNRKAQLNKFSSKIMSLIAPMKGGSKKNGTLKKKLKSLTKKKSVKHKSIPRQIGGAPDRMETNNWVFFGYNNNGQINFGIVYENLTGGLGVLKFAPPNGPTTTEALYRLVYSIIQSGGSNPQTTINNTSLIIIGSNPPARPSYNLILQPRSHDYMFGNNMNKFISYLYCNNYIDRTNTKSLLSSEQLSYLMRINVLGQAHILSTLNFVNGSNTQIRKFTGRAGEYAPAFFGTLTFLTNVNPSNLKRDERYIHIDKDNGRSQFISISELTTSLPCDTPFRDLNKDSNLSENIASGQEATGAGGGGGGGRRVVPMDVPDAGDTGRGVRQSAPVIKGTAQQQLHQLIQIYKSGKAPESQIEQALKANIAAMEQQQADIDQEKRRACEIICQKRLDELNRLINVKCLKIMQEISTKLDNLERQQNKYPVNLNGFRPLRIDIHANPIIINPDNLLGLEDRTVSIVYENSCKQVEFVKNLFLFIEQCDNLNAVKPWRNSISKLILGFMKRVVYGKTLGDMTGITIDKPGYNIFNLVLMGTPGVGKSYNANIIGKALFYSGLLAKGKLQVITSTDLIAGYIGQTKGQVAEKLAGALGDVFFLDEAYAIAGKPGPNKQFDKYGQEALDEITDFSSKNIGLLSFIVAGYEYEMQTQFLDVNPGLPRRFQTQIVLTRNSIKGLWNIVYSQMKQNFIGELYSSTNIKYHEACFQILNILFNYQVKPNPLIKGSEDLNELWRTLSSATGRKVFASRIKCGRMNEETQQIEPTETYVPFMQLNRDLFGEYIFPLGNRDFSRITKQFLQSFILYKTGIQNNSKFPPNGDLFRSQSDTMIKMAGMILNDFQTGKGLGLAQQTTTTPEQWADYIRYLYFDLFFKKNPAFPISIENITFEQTLSNQPNEEVNMFTIQSAYPDQVTMSRDILTGALSVAERGKQRPPGTGTRGTDEWWFFSNSDFGRIYEDLLPLTTAGEPAGSRPVEPAPAAAPPVAPLGTARPRTGGKKRSKKAGKKNKKKGGTRKKKKK